MSTFPTSDHEAAAAFARGRAWLDTLPRPPVAHDQRGDNPLARMHMLLDALGQPHQHLRTIHVAGSKGKGSTALYLERLLGELGFGTFTYTSPHLERWTERYRINGAEVDAKRASNALMQIRSAATRCDMQPGFFEALTAAAFVMAREHADTEPNAWCILETGVGGRADATNVVDPAVSVITGIELEHTDRLGTTLAAIAREKAGIIKSGRPAIIADMDRDAIAEIAAYAQRMEAPLTRLCDAARAATTPRHRNQVYWSNTDAQLRVRGKGWSLQAPCKVPGRIMAGNAALAIATVRTLGVASTEALQRAVRTISDTALPGRMEILSELPWVLVDGAHTAASAHALAMTLDELAAEHIDLILSVTHGKDLSGTCSPLVNRARRVIATCADPHWSLPAEQLGEYLHELFPECEIDTVSDPADAFSLLIRNYQQGTLIVAAGSAYLAGAIRHRMHCDQS